MIYVHAPVNLSLFEYLSLTLPVYKADVTGHVSMYVCVFICLPACVLLVDYVPIKMLSSWVFF